MKNVPSTPWNAGAWFGSQVGATAWLLISAIVLGPRSPLLAAAVLGLFLLANLAGVWLWRSRSRRSIFSALRIFLAVLWICGLAAILLVERAGLWRSLSLGGGGNVSASTAVLALTAMVAALIILFVFQERKASSSVKE